LSLVISASGFWFQNLRSASHLIVTLNAAKFTFIDKDQREIFNLGSNDLSVVGFAPVAHKIISSHSGTIVIDNTGIFMNVGNKTVVVYSISISTFVDGPEDRQRCNAKLNGSNIGSGLRFLPHLRGWKTVTDTAGKTSDPSLGIVIQPGEIIARKFEYNPISLDDDLNTQPNGRLLCILTSAADSHGVKVAKSLPAYHIGTIEDKVSIDKTDVVIKPVQLLENKKAI